MGTPHEPIASIFSLFGIQTRHTYTTRLLYTVLPAEMYAPDGASLQCLMECMVENINKLYTEGFQVPSLHIGSLV